MEDIVIATNNQGKINDFKAIFKNQRKRQIFYLKNKI